MIDPTAPIEEIKPIETHAEIGERIGALVMSKNAAYGSAYDKSGQVLRVLYPDGVPVDRYDDMLAITRVVDKLFRIASGNDGYAGESAWADIAGYGVLGVQRRQREQRARGARGAESAEHNSDDVPF